MSGWTDTFSRFLRKHKQGGFIILIGAVGSGKSDVVKKIALTVNGNPDSRFAQQHEIIDTKDLHRQVQAEKKKRSKLEQYELVSTLLVTIASRKKTTTKWVIIDSSFTKRQDRIALIQKLAVECNYPAIGVFLNVSEQYLTRRNPNPSDDFYALQEKQWRTLLETKPAIKEGFSDIFTLTDDDLEHLNTDD